MSTISKENKNDSKVVQNYWTKERRDKAIPKPMPDFSDKDVHSEVQIPRRPFISPPNMSIEDKENINVELDAGLAIPVNDPTTYPWSCNGKLFFTWKGKDYVGSAGSVFLEILLTAGHNVYDEGEWSDKFLYYPAYPDYGKFWGWTRAAIFTDWKNSTNYSHDYAMILTDSSMKEVGSMASIRNIPPKGRSWTAIGYPAEAPYSGEKMYKTTGDYVNGNIIITMNNNDMTKGSSGGNWLITIEDKEYVNGVQSTINRSASLANSPYLDNTDFNNLLNCAKTGDCK